MLLDIGLESWEVCSREGEKELGSFLDVEVGADAAAFRGLDDGFPLNGTSSLFEGLIAREIGLGRLNNGVSVGTSVSEGVDTGTSNIVADWPFQGILDDLQAAIGEVNYKLG